MRRVLLISYYFPPDGGGGTQRAAKFARYLPESGWSPTVLTRRPPASRQSWEPEDASLQDELGASVRVRRVAGLTDDPPVPMHADANDADHPWVRAATKEASDLLEAEPHDAILLTMPPYGLWALGAALQKRFDIPVVYDLRDPWALDGAPLYANRRQWEHSHACMSLALEKADGVVANTPEAGRALAKFAISLKVPLAVIPNGFDPEDFAETGEAEHDECLDKEGAGDPDLFTLVHVGTLHSGAYLKTLGLRGFLRRVKHFRARPIDIQGRTLMPLLRAVRLLEKSGSATRKVDVVQVGPEDPATRALLVRERMIDRVRFTGYLPHRASVAWMRRADALFLPLHGLPPGQRSLIVPGKAYEYAASGTPILAAVPEGDAREWVMATGRAEVADPCRPDQIAEALLRLMNRPRNERAESAQHDSLLAAFSRRRQASDLAAYLDGLIGGPPPVTEPRV